MRECLPTLNSAMPQSRRTPDSRWCLPHRRGNRAAPDVFPDVAVAPTGAVAVMVFPPASNEPSPSNSTPRARWRSTQGRSLSLSTMAPPSWISLCSRWAVGSKSTPKQWGNRGMVFIFLKPSFTVGWRRIEPRNLGSWHQLAPDAERVWEDRDDPDKLGPHARHLGERCWRASQYARCQRREATHRAPQVGDSVCVCAGCELG
jgi:hypothetical protein